MNFEYDYWPFARKPPGLRIRMETYHETAKVLGVSAGEEA
jgi:hypothetical protein